MSVPRPALSETAGPFAEVIVDVPVPGVDRVFHYAIPPDLAHRIQVGRMVVVPFGGRRVDGYVVGFSSEPAVKNVRPIISVRGEGPYFDGDALSLARWLARRYIALEADALRCLVPPGAVGAGRVGPRLVKAYRLAIAPKRARDIVTELARRAPRQAAVVAELLRLADHGEGSRPELPARDISRRTGAPLSSLQALVERGVLEPTTVRLQRRPVETLRVETSSPPPLTVEQRRALDVIEAERRRPRPHPVLLHGVTGSGKTEVYLRAIANTLSAGKGAIVLVPEIALTPQTFARFAARFGDQVAVLHSRLGAGERFDEWGKIASGRARIVVGARSAVFAPVRDLGLIVVDEEHETSYKQDETPRYNAKDVAVERARRTGALCILGSATPSMESYMRAQRGSYKLARLTKRIDDRPMPPVEIVDMRQEMLAGNRTIFSVRLREELAQCLSQGRQALLFLNRRGFAQFLLCRECGLVVRCDECAVSYTFHAEPAPHMRCHYCNELRAVPDDCPQCGGQYLRPFGAGTQRVETMVQSMFPHARVQRIDLDTTARKGAHARLFEAVRRGDVDVIVGTQMVAKGLDFPNVTLVGVIAADSTLHLPDFRAAERTFQLLTQVGGRAGRGIHPGRVIVQTYAPDHYSIVAAQSYDDAGFYRREAMYREGGGYPPFTNLVRVLVTTGENSPRAAQIVAEAVRLCAGHASSVSVTGPAPAPLHRLRGRYRWHVLIKGPGDAPRQVASAARDMWLTALKADEATVAVDVDPVSLM